MCDSFVSMPHLNARGHMILGKNSDREPDEKQVMVRYPARTRETALQKCTFIEVEHVRDTLEVILSRPFQMWGAEMGVNEKGVAIGNEAVFTRVPIQKKNTGLTGMDMLRLALESSPSAREALDKIIELNDRYGQDACGGYRDKGMYYHNSFLIADPREAYVLETAGPYWAVERVKGYRAISNGLSIGEHFDEIHPEAISHARRKGWVSKGEEFSFSRAYSAFWMPRLARCIARRTLSESQAKQGFTVADAFQVLRSHAEEPFEPSSGTTGSVCMHASGLFAPHQSVGSMVATLRSGGPHTVWMTGSSAPCLSIFKPFYFGDHVLDEAFPGQRNEYWEQWEEWHRKAIHDYAAAYAAVASQRKDMELDWLAADEEGMGGPVLTGKALILSEEVLVDLLQRRWGNHTSWLYNRFWKRR